MKIDLSRFMRVKDKNYLFYIFLLILFISVSNYFVVKLNKSYLFLDMLGYFKFSKWFAEVFKTQGFHAFTSLIFNFYKSTPSLKPPFLELFAAPFFIIFGSNDNTARMINVLFLYISAYSIYYSGKKLSNNKVGFFAVIIFLSFPAVIGHSRLFFLDFPLLAIVALSFCLLIYTDFFKRNLTSLLLGISIGIGCLIKQTFVFFIFPPLLYYLILSFKDSKNVARILVNLFITTIVASVILVTWYLPNFETTINLLHRCSRFTMLYGSSTTSIRQFYDYIMLVYDYQLHKLLSIVFLFSLVIFLLKKKCWQSKLIFVWLLFPIPLFVALHILDSVRFTLPMLPGYALFIAVIFIANDVRIPSKLSGAVFISIFLTSLIAPFTFMRSRYNDFECFLIHEQREGLMVPYRDNWRIKEAIDAILKDKDNSKISNVAIVLQINPVTYGFDYLNFIYNFPLKFTTLLQLPYYDCNEEYISDGEYIKMLTGRDKKRLLDFEYIIDITCNSDKYLYTIIDKISSLKLYNFFKKELHEVQDFYLIIEVLKLPKNLELIIYKRNN